MRRGAASGYGQRRALGARASCPHMRRKAQWFEDSLRPCAPGGACEGKMPSPPRAPRHCKSTLAPLGEKALCLPCAPIGALPSGRNELSALTRAREGRMPSLREERHFLQGTRGLRAPTAIGRTPGGEGILPSLCAARRIASKIDWPCAPGGACEGKMPSPPGDPSPLQEHAGALRREGILPSLCADRRTFLQVATS